MADLYSSNQLTNPSAETGDLTGWTTSGVAVVAGGTSGSNCFRLNNTGSMYQEKVFSSQPPDCKIEVDYLPEVEPAADDIDVKVYLKVEHEYSDGSKDTFIIPCRSDAGGVV